MTALLVLLSGLADLPNLLLGRSISEDVERGRRWACYWVALGLAPLALLLARRRETGIRGTVLRTLGLLGGAAPPVVAGFYIMGGIYFGGREPAGRAQCINNLKQILLALANYESAHGSFPPPAMRDHHGKPLLSWRVAILPYLEQPDLFEKFHLDEPWDSDHNRGLLGRMPGTYSCPAQAGWLKNQTLYQAIVGADTLWPPDRGLKLSELIDGTSGTILVVETDRPVPWTKPEDIRYRPDQPFPPWEAPHPNTFEAGFADGSVRTLKRTIRESTLRALVTRNGQEKLDPDQY
jgi:hypothetical protein